MIVVLAAPLVFAQKTIGINVVLNVPITDSVLAQLAQYGNVRRTVPEIQALTMLVPSANLSVIQKLPYVAAANEDQQRGDIPTNIMPVTNFLGGVSTWDQDAINVTVQPGDSTRAVSYDGTGVYVAVLDTGLLNDWLNYFPAERIATTYARSFGGGGAADNGATPEQPNKWTQDQNSHGTHVVSSIIGYKYGNLLINGAAPLATIIPVKVLNQNGSGWSSAIARGIVYIADLKAGDLAGHPMIISMSLSGRSLDAMEKAAVDYAIGKGVIIVAAASNSGKDGMGYPGAYAPVISVAATGWVGQWTKASWWRTADVADPTNPNDFYIATFSSRAKPGQDLDVAAPGVLVVGPYQTNGQTSYYYLDGTSMATPHVSGIVAPMAQKLPTLTASQAENILEKSAIPLAPGCRTVPNSNGTTSQVCWDEDATGAGLATADAALAKVP